MQSSEPDEPHFDFCFNPVLMPRTQSGLTCQISIPLFYLSGIR